MFDLTRDNMMIQTMDRALTLAAQRQTLIASNLANLDTPGYRTRDFSFEGALRAALSDPTSPPPLQATHAMHFQGSTSVPLPRPRMRFGPRLNATMAMM